MGCRQREIQRPGREQLQFHASDQRTAAPCAPGLPQQAPGLPSQDFALPGRRGTGDSLSRHGDDRRRQDHARVQRVQIPRHSESSHESGVPLGDLDLCRYGHLCRWGKVFNRFGDFDLSDLEASYGAGLRFHFPGHRDRSPTRFGAQPGGHCVSHQWRTQVLGN